MLTKAFIDAGHGGDDPGAVGNGLRECDINLAVAKRVKYHVERHGASVMMSRETDKTVSLQERTDMANKWGAQVFQSIHCNSFSDPSAKGTESFCYNFKYRGLADSVHNQIITKGLHNANRGVKEANFHVLRETAMDASLTEMAFISNTADAQLLRNKQEEYAICIAKGMLAYMGIKWCDEYIPPITPPTPPVSDGKLRRVIVDGKQIGAYKEASNVLNETKKAMDVGAKKIEITLV